MFTGIVEAKGLVVHAGKGGLRIQVPEFDDLILGGSVSVNGACLTVTGLIEHSFTADVVEETLRRTNLGLLRSGSEVNLERPVPAAGRLHGHIVQGHVDGTARVVSITDEGNSRLIRMELAPRLGHYMVEKGFVAVDGVSLTIVDCGENWLSVSIIPTTGTETILGGYAPGDVANIEIDILAKYVARLTADTRSVMTEAGQSDFHGRPSASESVPDPANCPEESMSR